MMRAEAFRQLVAAQQQQPVSVKIRLTEELLFQFTIAARAIWSDDSLPDKEVAGALKWLNEMTHRGWNILRDLRRHEDAGSMTRLYAHMQDYADICPELDGHLAAAFRAAIERIS